MRFFVLHSVAAQILHFDVECICRLQPVYSILHESINPDVIQPPGNNDLRLVGS